MKIIFQSYAKVVLVILACFLGLSVNAQIQIGQDIDGEAFGDQSGYSVNMPDANTVAIGADGNDGNGSLSGHVRIYSWDGSSWTQKGIDIDGESSGDQSGWSVSMPDTNTIAIGVPRNDGNGFNAGQVRIYTWDGSSWVKKGVDIDGEASGDQFGHSVSMPDANTVAIGADGNDGNGSDAGHVRIYSWDGSSWTQKGIDIDGEASGDRSGHSVSMPDANTVAIGGRFNDANGSNSGHVRIYSWDGSSWIQKGIDIDGEASDDRSGFSISMPDANTVAIGANENDGNGSNSGHVRIYSWDGSSWTQKGIDIDGEASYDESGFSVSMPDANTVAIGGRHNDGNLYTSGHVRIYSWDGSSWTQNGVDVDGEAPFDNSGYSVSMPDANTVAIGAPWNDGNGSAAGHVRVYSINNYIPLGGLVNNRGCIECDSLNIGDYFRINGDTMIVVNRPMLDSMIAGGHDVTKACVSHVTDMRNLLRGQGWFNQDIGSWDVSNVTNMNRMFKKASSFNQDISNWDVGNVNRMTGMFESASAFNQDLSDWCVRAFQYNAPPNFALNGALIPSHYPRWGNCPQDFDNITTLAAGAFLDSNGCIDCSALNIGDYFDLDGDTLLVVDRSMLDSLVLLHDDLSKVCVSNITDMTDALRGLSWFNTDISKWDVSNVTDMSNMFWKARIFNQDIRNWDVSKVTRMNRMFKVARDFNQDIGSWDVGKVERFQEMFRNADAFNQDIGYWNVSSVLNDVQMQSMFRSADNFSQDLSNWCVSSIASKPTGFDANSPLTASQLPLWGGCPPPASNLGTDTLSICGQDSVLISARSGFDSYAWNTGQTSSSIWVSQSGMYSVASTMSGQYTLDSSVYVSLVNASITASSGSVVCAGDSVSLAAGNGASALFNSVSSSNLPSYLPTNGLVAWYPFNGNANDESGNGNNGTVNGATLTADRGGNANSAYDFDGNGDFINCGNSSTLNITGSITISGWIYANNLNGEHGIVSKMNTGIATYELITANNLIRWMDVGGFLFSNSVNPNQWVHVVSVFDNSLLLKSIYINGILNATSSSSVSTIPANSDNLYIGAHQPSNVPSWSWDGQLDDIAIYNRALSPSEIQSLHTAQPSSNLTYNWSTGDTTASITANPAQTTTYYCTVSDGVTSCTDSLTVYVNNTLSLDLGADTLSVCGQDSVLLDAGAGYSSYAWSNGDSTQSITVNSSGMYSCTVGGGSCTATDSVYVSIVNASITASDSAICAGDSVTLSADNGALSSFNSPSSSNLPSYLPSNGLLGWYPFNGNANDESGNWNIGTTLNGVSLSTDRFGHVNSAYMVDGADALGKGISLPNTLINTGLYTISIWFQLTDTNKTVKTSAQTVFSSNPHTSIAVGFGHPYFPYKMGSCLGDASSWLQCSPSGIDWDLKAKLNWHNLVVVKSLTSYDYYIDAISVYTHPTTSSYNVGSFTLLLGAINVSSGEVFNGKLDDVAIWNRALSPHEIQSLYTAQPSSNLTYNWSTGDTTASITANPPQTTTYYCTVSDGITSCTDSVEIKVGLMDNPADVTVDLSLADTASFSVNYLDSSTSYQWQLNSPLGWTNLLDSSSYYVGGKSYLLKLRNIGTNFNGLEFRCIVTSPSCSEVSDSAVLTVIGAGAMLSNPVSLNEAVSQFIGENNFTSIELPVSIRPNPTAGIFYVHPFIEGTYSLIESKGRTVESGRATPSYDLSSYPNGVYILRLTLEFSTHQIKVIKQ